MDSVVTAVAVVVVVVVAADGDNAFHCINDIISDCICTFHLKQLK